MKWKTLDGKKKQKKRKKKKKEKLQVNFNPTMPESKAGELYVGVDLGTSCGVAIKDGDSIIADTWSFKTKRTQGMGMRYLKFKASLEDLLSTGKITALFYEEVRRHKGVAAAHVYGGFESHLLAFCDANKIPYSSIPVGTVKKRATGNGNASKEMMIAAAKKAFPSVTFGPGEDDKADALWILATGLDELN